MMMLTEMQKQWRWENLVAPQVGQRIYNEDAATLGPLAALLSSPSRGPRIASAGEDDNEDANLVARLQDRAVLLGILQLRVHSPPTHIMATSVLPRSTSKNESIAAPNSLPHCTSVPACINSIKLKLEELPNIPGLERVSAAWP